MAAKAKRYLVRTYVQGLRNGVPWPAVGEEIELSEAEAEDYLLFGYVVEEKDEDEIADPAEPVEQQPVAGVHPVHTALVATPDGEVPADEVPPVTGPGLTTENGPAAKAPRIAKK